MFLENFHKVIKTIHEDKHEFVAYVSNAMECAALSIGKYEGYEIIAKGDCTTITEDLCKILLPKPTFINNLLNNTMCNSYKCFCSEDLKREQYIAHISAKSSWDCLLNSMGNPKQLVIIQRDRLC